MTIIAAILATTTLDAQFCANFEFIRGDANLDDSIDVSDISYINNWLFGGGPAPERLDAADVNDDGSNNISDTSYLSNYLFDGGPQPPAPFPAQGVDPTVDPLDPTQSPSAAPDTAALLFTCAMNGAAGLPPPHSISIPVAWPYRLSEGAPNTTYKTWTDPGDCDEHLGGYSDFVTSHGQTVTPRVIDSCAFSHDVVSLDVGGTVTIETNITELADLDFATCYEWCDPPHFPPGPNTVSVELDPHSDGKVSLFFVNNVFTPPADKVIVADVIFDSPDLWDTVDTFCGSPEDIYRVDALHAANWTASVDADTLDAELRPVGEWQLTGYMLHGIRQNFEIPSGKRDIIGDVGTDIEIKSACSWWAEWDWSI